MKNLVKESLLMCYHYFMRQKFDVGDLVQVKQPPRLSGIILETEPINKGIKYSESQRWHPDEYKCKVQFVSNSEIKWVRAKWLEHLSKITE